jgi:hypothetical protein
VAASVCRSARLVNWQTAVAAYAAGVSTIVGAQQIIRELPSVRVIRTLVTYLNDEGELHYGLSVSASNAGRRPVTIVMVAWMSSKDWLVGVGEWKAETPFSLVDGETKFLPWHRDLQSIPNDAVFVVRDALGRFWPRRRRWRMKLRRLRPKWRRDWHYEEPSADR